jgi:hypothetical protein
MNNVLGKESLDGSATCRGGRHLDFTKVLTIKTDEENIDHLSQIVESHYEFARLHSALIGHPLGQRRVQLWQWKSLSRVPR